MLIIRSRWAAQELRRLTSDVQRVIGWSILTATGKNMRGLPVGAVHPNRRGECDHVMKQAIEVNRPYLRDQKFATPERSRGRQVAAASVPQKTWPT